MSALYPTQAVDILTRAIARVERKRAPHPHALTYKAGLVEGQFVLRDALPRYLVWHSYLRSQVPTPANIERALRRAQSYARWWAVLQLLESGVTPPRPIPARLRHWPTVAQRADLPGDSTDDGSAADGPSDAGDGSDPVLDDADFYDQPWVQDFLNDADQDVAYQPMPKEAAQPILEAIGRELIYYDWLEGSFLSDLQVLQILNGFFNQQTATAAGQQFLDAAGIQGAFDLTDPNMLDYLRTQAGAYIQGISEHTRQAAAQALWEGFSGEGAGKYLSVDGIARYMQDQLNAYQNELTGMSDRRARMIATTEVARAESFGGYISMLQTGVTRVVWVITTGACLICEGNASMGSIPILDVFPSGHHAPPAHPLCFPAGTMVSGPKVIGSTTRWYEGRLVKIRTRGGNFLSATPNHPILTPHGWVAIGELRKGDQVVCGLSHHTSLQLADHDPDEHDVPALIEDVARTFSRAGSMTTSTVKTSPQDFHGDGGPDGQVCVIRTDSTLGDTADTTFSQPDLQQLLSRRDTNLAILSRQRRSAFLAKGDVGAAHRRMRLRRVPLVLLRRARRHQQAVRLALRSQRNFRGQQRAMNHAALYTKSDPQLCLRFSGEIPLDQQRRVDGLMRPVAQRNIMRQQDTHDRLRGSVPKRHTNMLRRFTCEVTFDDIVLVDTQEFSGHVYNLETAYGWYVAHDSIAHRDSSTGIIVHNCRCTLAPELPEFGDPTAFDPRDWAWTPDMDQVQRLLGDPSYALWPKQVVDLQRPEYALLDRANVSLVEWEQLPQAIQDLLTPDALNAIQQQLGTAVQSVDLDDFLSRVQALQANRPPRVIHQTPVAGTPIEATPLLTPEQIAERLLRDPSFADPDVEQKTQEAEQQIVDMLRKGLEAIQDLHNTENES